MVFRAFTIVHFFSKTSIFNIFLEKKVPKISYRVNPICLRSMTPFSYIVSHRHPPVLRCWGSLEERVRASWSKILHIGLNEGGGGDV